MNFDNFVLPIRILDVIAKEFNIMLTGLQEHNRRPIINICGPAGIGKTTFGYDYLFMEAPLGIPGVSYIYVKDPQDVFTSFSELNTGAHCILIIDNVEKIWLGEHTDYSDRIMHEVYLKRLNTLIVLLSRGNFNAFGMRALDLRFRLKQYLMLPFTVEETAKQLQVEKEIAETIHQFTYGIPGLNQLFAGHSGWSDHDAATAVQNWFEDLLNQRKELEEVFNQELLSVLGILSYTYSFALHTITDVLKMLRLPTAQTNTMESMVIVSHLAQAELVEWSGTRPGYVVTKPFDRIISHYFRILNPNQVEKGLKLIIKNMKEIVLSSYKSGEQPPFSYLAGFIFALRQVYSPMNTIDFLETERGRLDDAAAAHEPEELQTIREKLEADKEWNQAVGPEVATWVNEFLLIERK